VDTNAIQKTRDAWRLYVETGRVDDRLLRSQIFHSWRRCKAENRDPATLGDTRLSPGDTAALLQKEAPLLEAAHPYLRALSLAASGEKRAALLADARGIVLDVVGDPETLSSGFPAPGMQMSEAVAGSNGIGTALAEDDYVEVIGPEHFVETLCAFTCQGLPLRQHGVGTVGVLALVVRRLEAASRVREILFCAAQGIEAELMRRRVERGMRHVFAGNGSMDGSAETLWQDIVQLHAAARVRFETAAQGVRKDRHEHALHLIRLADGLAKRFARQTELWLEIANDDVGAAQHVDLTARVAELVGLLETTSAIRGVRIAQRGETVFAFEDTRALTRRVFRAIFRGLEEAPAGGVLEIHVTTSSRGAEIRLSTGETFVFPARPWTNATPEGP
jgi:transcriptional regulator of acetoin/glycerol metabolism